MNTKWYVGKVTRKPQRYFLFFSLIGMTCSSIGCSLQNEKTTDYSICNATSHRNMAEVESGFFYCPGDILYYADRDHMETWIPVCNKPECIHRGDFCNAYVPSYFTQVLTENYMIETNRYWKNQPQEAYMKFYNGEKWIEFV